MVYCPLDKEWIMIGALIAISLLTLGCAFVSGRLFMRKNAGNVFGSILLGALAVGCVAGLALAAGLPRGYAVSQGELQEDTVFEVVSFFDSGVRQYVALKHWGELDESPRFFVLKTKEIESEGPRCVMLRENAAGMPYLDVEECPSIEASDFGGDSCRRFRYEGDGKFTVDCE